MVLTKKCLLRVMKFYQLSLSLWDEGEILVSLKKIQDHVAQATGVSKWALIHVNKEFEVTKISEIQ